MKRRKKVRKRKKQNIKNMIMISQKAKRRRVKIKLISILRGFGVLGFWGFGVQKRR